MVQLTPLTNFKSSQIFTKADIINYIGKQYNLSSYLEISTTSTGHSYTAVDSTIFSTKEIIFYANADQESLRLDLNISIMSYPDALDKFGGRKFDIVFVDPWHTFEHSKRDIDTALMFVKDEGFIIIHDCNPINELLIGSYHPGSWCGQTYEAFIDFKINNPTIESFVVNTDYGCGIIRKNKILKEIYDLVDDMRDVWSRWEYFDKNRNKLLDLITIDEFIERVNMI